MTDEELLGYLRRSSVGYTHPLRLAADRIEALRAERDDAVIKRAAWELEAKTQKARAERLEAAMIQMRDDRTAFRHAVHFRRFITAALSRCPYGASGDDCCGGYCSMDDDQKGGDACDKDDDPTNARPATSPGVTAGAIPKRAANDQRQ